MYSRMLQLCTAYRLQETAKIFYWRKTMKKCMLCMAAAPLCAGMLFAGGGQDSNASANKSGGKELTVAIWDSTQEPGLTKILSDFTAAKCKRQAACHAQRRRHHRALV